MAPFLQTLPSFQVWIRDLQNAAGNDEIENLLGYIEQWVQRAHEELPKSQLKGTVPLLLNEAAVELFNLSVYKSELLGVPTKAKIRSAACSLLNISPANDDLDSKNTVLRIHYFTAAAWHEAQEFEQAELFLGIASESLQFASSSPELSPEMREAAFNIHSLRSDNYWAMDREQEAKAMALKALKNLDQSASLWFHLKLYNKGVKLYQASLMEKAEEWLKMSLEALTNGTSHPQAEAKRTRTRRVLALTLKSSGKCDEALQTINLCLQSGSIDVDCLYLKTELLIKLKKFEEASETLLQTIRHAGCGQKMGIGLCQMLKDAGRPSISVLGFNELIVKYPESTKIRIWKLRCLLSAEDIENGAPLAEQILSDHVSSRRELCEEDIEEFRNILNSIALHFFEIRLFSSCSEWIARSERLAASGNDEGKNIYLCRCALSIAEIEQGNTKEALHCALKADHLFPQLSLAKLIAAHCHLLLNDQESAKTHLKEAFRLEEFDRKYLSIILSVSAKAEFTECAALCIEELLYSDEATFDKVLFLKCAIDFQYKIAVKASESSDDETLKQAMNRICQHLRSAVQLIQSRMLEVSANADLLADTRRDADWFGKAAWNSGITSSKRGLCISCSNCFHFSATLFQMIPGSQETDHNYRILVGLCMSATAAMQQLLSSHQNSQQCQADCENLCNFCLSRIREFHVAAKATSSNSLLSNLYPIVHIVELELKLIVDDPNIDIHIRNSVNIPGWKATIFEEIASICLRPPFLKRNVAISALQALLVTELGVGQQEATTLNVEQVSKTIRQLITLTDNIDRQLPLFEQAKTLGMSIASTALTYPKLEAQWLISRSWNNGVISYRAGRWESAEMWMSTSIQLMNMFGDSCSNNKQEMIRSHAFVLSRVQHRSKNTN